MANLLPDTVFDIRGGDKELQPEIGSKAQKLVAPAGIDAVKGLIKKEDVQPHFFAVEKEMGNGQNEQIVGHGLLSANPHAFVRLSITTPCPPAATSIS